MGGINRRQRAQRIRRANERRALNPCTLKRQLLRAQRQRLQNRTFHPFLRLPAELKLRVLELADLDSIRNISGTCRTMASLWAANSEVVWNVLLKERYRLEAKVLGPAESFPSFGELAGRKKAQSLERRRTAGQEAAIESAAQAVVMRRDTQWMHGGTFCAAPMTGLSVEARRGGFGYLKLLDEISRCVDADMNHVKHDLAAAGVADVESFRPAVMLLWRMKWWKIENVPDPGSFIIARKRYRVLDDNERVALVADEPAESKERFRILLEILAWKLGRSFSVDAICWNAITEERQQEEEEGGDRQIPQLHALLWTEMEGWLMREVIERGLREVLLPSTCDPTDELRVAGRDFCSKKVAFLRHTDLRDIITERGVWMERQTDLVSRIKEMLGSRELDLVAWEKGGGRGGEVKGMVA